jgi:hypothetical protein
VAALSATGVSLQKEVYPSNASANHAAFVSEAGVQLKYRVAVGQELEAGCDALWLEDAAHHPRFDWRYARGELGRVNPGHKIDCAPRYWQIQT